MRITLSAQTAHFCISLFIQYALVISLTVLPFCNPATICGAQQNVPASEATTSLRSEAVNDRGPTALQDEKSSLRSKQDDDGGVPSLAESIYWTLRAAEKEEVSFAGLNEKNVFGYHFYKSDGKTPADGFTGDPESNGRMAARRLNAIGGSDARKAIRYTKPSSQPARRASWDSFAGRFRDFFNCYRP